MGTLSLSNIVREFEKIRGVECKEVEYGKYVCGLPYGSGFPSAVIDAGEKEIIVQIPIHLLTGIIEVYLPVSGGAVDYVELERVIRYATGSKKVHILLDKDKTEIEPILEIIFDLDKYYEASKLLEKLIENNVHLFITRLEGKLEIAHKGAEHVERPDADTLEKLFHIEPPY